MLVYRLLNPLGFAAGQLAVFQGANEAPISGLIWPSGLDWASENHSVVVVDSHGKVIEDFEIEHSALGWKKFRERMKPHGSIPFAIETSQGSAVEQLLEAGMKVYPLNPKSAQAYRERKAPSGVKDDRLDAWSFADACRVDGQGWKPLHPEDPLIKELRLLCRAEVGLIETTHRLH